MHRLKDFGQCSFSRNRTVGVLRGVHGYCFDPHRTLLSPCTTTKHGPTLYNHSGRYRGRAVNTVESASGAEYSQEGTRTQWAVILIQGDRSRAESYISAVALRDRTVAWPDTCTVLGHSKMWSDRFIYIFVTAFTNEEGRMSRRCSLSTVTNHKLAGQSHLLLTSTTIPRHIFTTQ